MKFIKEVVKFIFYTIIYCTIKEIVKMIFRMLGM